MAYAADIHNTRRSAGLRDRIAAFLGDVAARREKAQLYRRTLRELQGLSPRELDDLGLDRFSLREVAHKSTYGV